MLVAFLTSLGALPGMGADTPGTVDRSDGTWTLRAENGVVGSRLDRTAELGVIPLLSSFGYDGFGELYVTSQQGGVVSKIIPAP